MSHPNVGRSLITALERRGVDRVFGIPGSHVLPAYDALLDSPIRVVSAANESASVFMAGAYGFLTGRPGVALLTAGPGAVNSAGAVAQAYASSYPLVQITGDVPFKAPREAFHGTDRPDFLHQLFNPITKWAHRLQDPAELPAVLTRAFEIAMSGRRGPVHLSIPVDFWSKPVATSAAPHETLPHSVDHESVDHEFVEQLIGALTVSKRPFIVAGRGALAEPNSGLAELAQRLCAPVLCTAYAVGAIPSEHPLAFGTFSEFTGNTLAFDRLRQSDLVLVLGMRSDTLMSAKLADAVSCPAFFVALENEDWSPRSASWPGPITAADVKQMISTLLAQLPMREPDHQLTSDIATTRRFFRNGLETSMAAHATAQPLHFGLFLRALSAAIKSDEDEQGLADGDRAIALSGVGNHHIWARNVLPVWDRTSFIAEAAWGTMGAEVAAGIGAKLAHPERRVVVVTGDGSLLMALGEIATAVFEQTHILIVVLNDSRHGIIAEMQRRMFRRSSADAIPRIDFAAHARSMGAVGLRVEHPNSVKEDIRKALQALKTNTVLLDVVSDSTVSWPTWDGLVELGRAQREKGGIL